MVSSVAPTKPSGMPASCSATIRSPPSSIAACGFDFAAASMPGAGSWPRRASTPSASATSSWVESGFDAASSTSAPPASSARTRLAVSAVTCRHAATRRPLSGFFFANRSPIERTTGIWPAAHSMRSRSTVR